MAISFTKPAANEWVKTCGVDKNDSRRSWIEFLESAGSGMSRQKRFAKDEHGNQTISMYRKVKKSTMKQFISENSSLLFVGSPHDSTCQRVVPAMPIVGFGLMRKGCWDAYEFRIYETSRFIGIEAIPSNGFLCGQNLIVISKTKETKPNCGCRKCLPPTADEIAAELALNQIHHVPPSVN
jgi:hypothetical protein